MQGRRTLRGFHREENRVMVGPRESQISPGLQGGPCLRHHADHDRLLPRVRRSRRHCGRHVRRGGQGVIFEFDVTLWGRIHLFRGAVVVASGFGLVSWNVLAGTVAGVSASGELRLAPACSSVVGSDDHAVGCGDLIAHGRGQRSGRRLSMMGDVMSELDTPIATRFRERGHDRS